MRMRKVTDFANVAAGVLLGLYLLFLTISGAQRLIDLPAWLVSSWAIWLLAFFAGALLLYLNIRLLVQEWQDGGLRWMLRISTEEGPSELSVTALEALLVRELKDQPDVVDPLVTIYPKREGYPIICIIELSLKRQDDVIRRTDALKKMVRSSFLRLIPSGVTVEIRAEIRNIVDDAPTPANQTFSEFSGPVYPEGTDDDDNVH